jgi:uncharacterized protein
MKRLAVLALLALLAGCGSSPKTHFYALAPVPPAGAHGEASGPPIVVDAVRLPAVLDRLQLVRSSGETRLDISDADRWGAPLDQMSRRTLARDLAARLPPGMVLAVDQPKPPGGTRALVVSVQRFDADAAGRVRLDAVWTLFAGSPQRPVLERRSAIVVDGAGDFAAQPAAMSRALGKLADDIAEALARGEGAVQSRGSAKGS